MGLTQQLFADKLGVRQQTVSEWEKSMYRPRGATVTLLNIIAEQVGFKIDTESAQK
jgi:DNA-binding transcriptional regulator YiaG